MLLRGVRLWAFPYTVQPAGEGGACGLRVAVSVRVSYAPTSACSSLSAAGIQGASSASALSPSSPSSRVSIVSMICAAVFWMVAIKRVIIAVPSFWPGCRQELSGRVNLQ